VEKVQPGLSPEIMAMLRQSFGEDNGLGLMAAAAAAEHRLKLMDERTILQDEVEDNWTEAEYNFCEH
jgi:hypothetical protein